jgi:hypothetical protein
MRELGDVDTPGSVAAKQALLLPPGSAILAAGKPGTRCPVTRPAGNGPARLRLPPCGGTMTLTSLPAPDYPDSSLQSRNLRLRLSPSRSGRLVHLLPAG